MSTQISPRQPRPNVKLHKPSKFASLGIVWLAVAIFIVLIVAQGFNLFLNRGHNESKTDPNIVAVTPGGEADVLQPVSPKVVALDESPAMMSPQNVAVDYTDVWFKLDMLAASYGEADKKNGSVSAENRLVFIRAFLDGLNYKMTAVGEPILSKVNGEQVRPETVSCYLNGFIPDKPYLKANCPTY